MTTTRKTQKRAKQSRSKQSSSPIQVPVALKDKTVQHRLRQLQQTDQSLADKDELAKDNRQFMSLAQKLKKLMVKKKRL